MNKVVNLSERRKAAAAAAAAKAKAAQASGAPGAQHPRAKLAWLVVSVLIVAVCLFWQPIWNALT